MSEWLILLKTGTSHERALAASSIDEMADEADRAIPDLLNGCRDSFFPVRRICISALCRSRVAPQVLLGVLLAAAEDVEAGVRCQAIWGLGQIQSGGEGLRAALLKALHDSEDLVRGAAVVAIGKSGAVWAIPKVVAALSDPAASVREAAALSLCRFGPKAAAAKDAIRSLLIDESPRVRLKAAVCCYVVLSEVDPAERALEEGIAHPDVEIQADALLLSSQLDRSSKSLLTRVAGACTSASCTVRTAAMAAIGASNWDLADLSPRLLAGLSDSCATVRREALRALRTRGQASRVGADQLRKLLIDEDHLVRTEVAAAQGSGEAGAVALLSELLRDVNPEVREAAAGVAAGFANQPELITSRLRELVNVDSVPSVRRAAREALDRAR